MAARSFSRDRSVAQRKLSRGTWRRVLSYARPYRGLITVFLALVVLDYWLLPTGDRRPTQEQLVDHLTRFLLDRPEEAP